MNCGIHSEKGIRVMAPAPYKMEREQDKIGADGKPVLDKDGEPVKEVVEVKVNAFKPVSTFDISQTDGEPVPRLGVDELTGSVEGYATLMEAIKQASPVPISFENIESGAKGYFQVEENRIAIQEGMSEAQTVKTALHEASHATLHNKEAQNSESDKKTRRHLEVKFMPYAVDLFCGAGGCSEGLIQAGFHILFSSDISDMVEKTYVHRHEQLGLIQGKNTWFERADIRNLTGDIIHDRIASLEIFKNKKVPEIDLMIGGPSCQGFSRAGRRDKNDPRNMLFGEYVRVINQIRPKYIVLENVEGFMDMQFIGYVGITGIKYPDGSVTPDLLQSELKEIGYDTLEPRILNAADYGVPQRRRRVIFIGYRKGEKVPSYPEPTTPNKHLTLKDAIGDLIIDDSLRIEINSKKSRYQTESRKGRTPRIDGSPIPLKGDLTCTKLPNATPIVTERFTLFLPGESGTNLRKRIKEQGIDLSKVPLLVELCSEKLAWTKKQVIKNFADGKVDDDAIDILLTKKNIRQRWDGNQPSATIVSIADDYISPWEPRTFSVREMARCQSFDDSFEFLGKVTTGGLNRRVEVPQYTQVGNAVPPLLAKAVALEIIKVL